MFPMLNSKIQISLSMLYKSLIDLFASERILDTSIFRICFFFFLLRFNGIIEVEGVLSTFDEDIGMGAVDWGSS